MDDLFLQIAHSSVNKHNEILSGDFYTVIKNLDSTTVVLSDGLGSGVKANILATLTAKILSTLLSNNLSMEESVFTMARTLPVCKERKLAYATFSALRFEDNKAYIAQYDNPKIIVLRQGKNYIYPSTRTFIEDKEIYESTIEIFEGDVFVVISDGVVHSGIGKLMDDGWKRQDVVKHLEHYYSDKLSAQRIAANIINASMALNLDRADDDTSALIIKVKRRNAVNMIIGPPHNKNDDNKTLRLFFSKEGKYIVCGGSTANAVSRYLGKPLKIIDNLDCDYDIPPIASIEGVDLVTEGIITIGKVVELSREYIKDSSVALKLEDKKDGASLIAKMIFEEATDVNIFFGQSINEGNEESGLDIDFKTKCKLLKELENNLSKLDKKIKISKC